MMLMKLAAYYEGFYQGMQDFLANRLKEDDPSIQEYAHTLYPGNEILAKCADYGYRGIAEASRHRKDALEGWLSKFGALNKAQAIGCTHALTSPEARADIARELQEIT